MNISTNARKYLGVCLVVASLGVIGAIGHRHWFTSTPEVPAMIEEPNVTVPATTPHKTSKPRKAPKAKPSPQPAPKTGPRRECDASVWCWTYF